MDIQIDNQNAAGFSFQKQRLGSHRQIVENTKTRSKTRKGVVGSAGSIAGQPELQGQPGGQQGPPHRRAGAQNQPFAPWQSDSPHRLLWETALAECPHVFRFMNPAKQLRRSYFRCEKLPRLGHPLLKQQPVENPEFGHGKAVPLRQRRYIMGMIYQGKRHQGWGRCFWISCSK